MKVVKPFRLGFFFRTFEHRRRHHLVCTALACFPYDDPHAFVPEPDTWKMLTAELGKFGMFDQGMWKERGEVLALAHAFPPNPPQPHCNVRLRLGAIDKQLYVFGDRRWTTTGPTDPEPFERMPVSWERAFGGEGFEDNPAGRGAAKVERDGKRFQPLPNVEHPKRLVRAQRDRPAPASFAPEDFTNHQRFKRMGTYDRAWRDKRFPGLADDIDWSVFNVAQRDQQITGMFEGGESFELTHMHPDKPRLSGTLPRVRARCLLARGRSDELEDLTMRLDTVVLLPHLERGIALFRGVAVVESYDAHEVSHAVVAFEDVGENRPASHYVEALENRLDRERAHLYALRDRDLMPTSLSSLPATPTETDPVVAAIKDEGIALARQQGRVNREIERTKEKMRAMGVEPLDDELPALDGLLDDDPQTVIEEGEKIRERVEAQRAERAERMEAMARANCEAKGLDYDTMRAQWEEPPGGPPDFRAETHFARLRDLAEAARKGGAADEALEAQLADPDYRAQVEKQERDLLELYRASAHFQGPAALAGEESRALARQRAIIACEVRESLDGVDLTGVDLSGLDLREASFAGALLERASFAGASLQGADFRGAVLARADLRGAELEGAKLSRANLGQANLSGANLARCDLEEAILDAADLSKATLDGATLSGTMVAKIRVDGARFDGAVALRMTIRESDLTGSSWEGARLQECIFLSVDVSGVSFARAELVKTVFTKSRGRGARFADAKMVNVAFLDGAELEEAVFEGARMNGSMLRGATLCKASFNRADAKQCDFSEANLTDADLTRMDATQAYFIRTDLTRARLDESNLMNGIFHYAKLAAASFRAANLFSADFSRAVGDRDTSFADALLGRVVKMDAS